MTVQLKKFHAQGQWTNECWFACFLMVHDTMKNVESDYDGKKRELATRGIIQYVINEVGINPYKDGAGADVVKELLEEEVCRQQFGRPGNSGDRFALQIVRSDTDMDRLLTEVERSLNQGFPAVIGIDKGRTTGHFCVVVGVENRELIIVDPLGDGRTERKKITADITTFIYRYR